MASALIENLTDEQRAELKRILDESFSISDTNEISDADLEIVSGGANNPVVLNLNFNEAEDFENLKNIVGITSREVSVGLTPEQRKATRGNFGTALNIPLDDPFETFGVSSNPADAFKGL